jgi:pilus assembly protein Flp/PilA
MTKHIEFARKFIASEDAPTMVEYGLLVALIALVVAVAASIMGKSISGLFDTAANSV